MSRYRIGAVSRMTGVAPDTLRVWERRYEAVSPYRSENGTRLYDKEDVARIALIKSLVDSGDAISLVANLSTEHLRKRAQDIDAVQIPGAAKRRCRLVILGGTLAGRLETAADGADELEIVGSFSEKEEFLLQAPRLKADIAMLEYATIQPEQVRDIGSLVARSGAQRAIVLYRFASSTTLEQLESPRISTVRGPIDRPELRRLCTLLYGQVPVAQPSEFLAGPATGLPEGSAPSRRIDESTLASVAAASVSARCECPHHLVDLIASLNAFEDYSLECEALNQQDAALHNFLHSTAAQARALLEIALVRVIEVDGIPVDLDPERSHER